jgi:protein ImuA
LYTGDFAQADSCGAFLYKNRGCQKEGFPVEQKMNKMEGCMMGDSSSGQVMRLAGARGVADVPAHSMAQAVLKDALSARPFDAAVTAFVLACLPKSGAPVLWVQDRASRLENGRVYGPALRGVQLLRVEVSHARDVLWAMEEGAACAGLSAVVGEVHGAPPVLDFTATKRLALRAETSGVPVWLIRSGAVEGLSAARERWRVGSLPSDLHPYNAAAPGAPVWEAELFRARGRAPGIWAVRGDVRENGLRFLSRSGDGPLAQDHGGAAHAAG